MWEGPMVWAVLGALATAPAPGAASGTGVEGAPPAVSASKPTSAAAAHASEPTARIQPYWALGATAMSDLSLAPVAVRDLGLVGPAFDVGLRWNDRWASVVRLRASSIFFQTRLQLALAAEYSVSERLSIGSGLGVGGLAFIYPMAGSGVVPDYQLPVYVALELPMQARLALDTGLAAVPPGDNRPWALTVLAGLSLQMVWR